MKGVVVASSVCFERSLGAVLLVVVLGEACEGELGRELPERVASERRAVEV